MFSKSNLVIICLFGDELLKYIKEIGEFNKIVMRIMFCLIILFKCYFDYKSNNRVFFFERSLLIN